MNGFMTKQTRCADKLDTVGSKLEAVMHQLVQVKQGLKMDKSDGFAKAQLDKIHGLIAEGRPLAAERLRLHNIAEGLTKGQQQQQEKKKSTSSGSCSASEASSKKRKKPDA